MCGRRLLGDDLWRHPEETALRSDGDTLDTWQLVETVTVGCSQHDVSGARPTCCYFYVLLTVHLVTDSC